MYLLFWVWRRRFEGGRSVLEGIRPTIETAPLEAAAEAYGGMMRNETRFRMVLVTGP